MTVLSAGQDVAKMVIFSVYVVNKAGGLIYQYDNYVPRAEVEKTFSFPLDLVLKHHDEKVVVSFGQRDGIRGIVSEHTLACFTNLANVSFNGSVCFMCCICRHLLMNRQCYPKAQHYAVCLHDS